MGFIASALMGVGNSIAGGILKGHAAGDAANVQSQAAKAAQDLELKNQQAAIASQNTATSTNQANEQPYQEVGSTSANNLRNLVSTGFTAPTLAEAEQNPGYEFALESGTNALDKSAAARGDVFTGTQGEALQKFGQDLGTTNYQQVYNNALSNYMTNYQTLLGATNVGQTAVGEMGQLGQEGAQNLGYVDLTGGAQQAQQINNAAAARASGYIGTANAYANMSQGIANAANPLTQLNYG